MKRAMFNVVLCVVGCKVMKKSKKETVIRTGLAVGFSVLGIVLKNKDEERQQRFMQERFVSIMSARPESTDIHDLHRSIK